MEKSKLVSAVIPFYGEPADTLDLVSQLKNQTIAEDIEIIVSDDHSPIPFPEIEGITVIRRTENGGFGANVNSGVTVAHGTWLFILNSDLSLPSNFVEKAVLKAENLGQAIFAPQILGHDGKPQYVGRAFPRTYHFAWEWFTPMARFRSTKFWHVLVGHDTECKTGITRDVDWVMGACMILPLALYRSIGGMDERFFMNSEEVDLQFRLKQRGIRRVFAGDIVVEHIGGASSGDQLRRRQWVLNSRYIYADKWNTLKNLSSTLIAVTYANYLFNKIRSLRNADVTPEETKRIELATIKNAEAKARNRADLGQEK